MPSKPTYTKKSWKATLRYGLMYAVYLIKLVLWKIKTIWYYLRKNMQVPAKRNRYLAVAGGAFIVALVLLFAAPLAYRYITKPKPLMLSQAKSSTGFLYVASSKKFDALIGEAKTNAPGVKMRYGDVTAVDFMLTQINPNAKKPVKTGNKVLFADVRNNVDLTYETLTNGVKEEIILKQPQQGNAFTFDLTTSGAAPKKDPVMGYSPSFYDSEGNYLFHFEKPFAVDAKGVRTDNVVLNILSSKEDITKYKISVVVDQVWLDDPTRAYPVTIDPTVVDDTTAEFSPGQFNRVTDTGSGVSPNLTTYYQELATDINTIGLWHMNEASGNILDVSGNGYTGTPTGTTVVSGQTGFGNTRSFNGSSDYISTTSPGITGSGNRTVEAWIQTSTLADQNVVYWGTNLAGQRYEVKVSGTGGVLRINCFTGNAIGSTNIVDGKWHHIAVVLNGTDCTNHALYVDGKAETIASSVSYAINTGTTYTVKIGYNPVIPDTYFNGSIDEVRISNIARTPEEIKASAQRRPYSVFTSDVKTMPNLGFNPLTWNELGVNTGDGETPYSTTGLVAQWNFNETSGVTAAKNAGSCTTTTCDLTLTNFDSTASQDANSTSCWTANNRKWGAGALLFDGVNSVVTCTDANCGTTSKLDIGSNNWSVSAWINTTRIARQIIAGKGIAAGQYSYTLETGFSADGKPGFILYNTVDGVYIATIGPTAVNDGRWHHLVGTYDGTTISIYVDGIVAGSSTFKTGTQVTDSTSNFEIGARNATGLPFLGLIDSVQVYSRALTANEIISNYQAGNVELQTRVGDTTDPNDGSWEAWSPTTGEAAIDDFDSNQLTDRVYELDIADHFTNQNWQKINNTIESASNNTGTYGRLPVGVSSSGDDDDIYDSSVIKDGSTYKMWYGGNDGTNVRIYYATSSDGLTWTKYNNTTAATCDTTCEGNGKIGLGTNGTGDDAGVRSPSVIKDGSTYKMWYTGYDGTNNRIYYATSSDGLTWTKYDNSTPANSDTSSTNGRIPLGTSGKGDDSAVRTATVIKDGSTYKMWYAGQVSSVLRIYYATSSDGLSWTKNNNTTATTCDTICQGSGKLGLGTGGADNGGIYMPVVIKDGDVYKMWYGGLVSSSSNYRVLYATSFDGLTWIKQNNAIETASDLSGTYGRVPLGSSGKADETQTYPQSVIKDNGVYKMWYTCDTGTIWKICGATMNPLPYSQSTNTIIKQEGTGSEKFSFGQPQADANVVGLWHLDETSGTSAYIKDSASTNHGTPTGTTVVDGFAGKARSFNGSSDYIKITNSVTTDTSGTVCAWINPTTVRAYDKIVASADEASTTYYITFQIDANGRLSVAQRNNDTAQAISGSTVLSAKQWYHACWVSNGSTYSIYLNGVAESLNIVAGTNNGDWFGDTSARDNLMFGAQQTTSISNYFGGIIDEVKISKVARSAEEVAEEFRAGRDHYLNKTISSTDLSSKTSLPFYVASDRQGTFMSATIGESAFANYQPDANTVGLWHLEEQAGSGAYIKDSSSNNNHASVGGGTPTFSQGKIGKARSFNGSSDYILNSTANFRSGDSAGTIDAWIKPDNFTTTSSIFYSSDQASANYYFGLGVHTNGAVFIDQKNNDTASTVGGTTAMTAGQWYHVAVVSNGTSWSLYVNGVLEPAGVWAGSNNGDWFSDTTARDNFTIGAIRVSSVANYFAGEIDEIRISNVARTADEIRQAFEIGARTHPITIDFKAKLNSGNLIADTNDLSFTIDSTAYGATAMGSNLYHGDKIIVKENVDGTEYIAQGTVNALTVATGATTVTAWDSGSTVPSGGFTVNATVFKWQREYFDPRGSLSTHRDAITNLTLRLTDGSQGANVWLDDLRSTGGYLTTPAGSTVASTSGNDYFQYRIIETTFDTNVSSSITSATIDYTSPTLIPPTIGVATGLAGGTSIRWNFTDNSNDEDGFKVFDTGDTLKSTCATPGVSYCNETGLSINTQYTRKVAAYNAGNGTGTYSDTASRYTLAVAPSAPTVANREATTINVTPSGGSNPSGTELAIYKEVGATCDGSGGSYIAANGSDNGSTAVWQTAAVWGVKSVTGLDPETLYAFCVKARNGDGIETTFSSAVSNDGGIFPISGDLTITGTSGCVNRAVDGDNQDRYICGVDSVGTINPAKLTIQSGTYTVAFDETVVAGAFELTGGSIIIINGGKLDPGVNLYVLDHDQDGYPDEVNTLYIGTDKTGDFRRKYTMNSLQTLDCNTTDDTKNLVCGSENGSNCTVSGDCLSNICDYDTDGDGYWGTSGASKKCLTGSSLGVDCNDNDAALYQNLSCYVDADSDTYTVGTAGQVCSGAACPSGYIASSTGADCNDTGTNAANVYISTTCYVDADNDNYGSTTAKTCMNNATCGSATWGSGGAGTTAAAGDFATNSTDCNDTGANSQNVYISATCYVDADNDNYGSTTLRSCMNNATCGSATWGSLGTDSAAAGDFASNNTDCDDANASKDTLTEVCTNTCVGYYLSSNGCGNCADNGRGTCNSPLTCTAWCQDFGGCTCCWSKLYAMCAPCNWVCQ